MVQWSEHINCFSSFESLFFYVAMYFYPYTEYVCKDTYNADVYVNLQNYVCICQPSGV